MRFSNTAVIENEKQLVESILGIGVYSLCLPSIKLKLRQKNFDTNGLLDTRLIECPCPDVRHAHGEEDSYEFHEDKKPCLRDTVHRRRKSSFIASTSSLLQRVVIFFEGITEKGKKNFYIFILAYRIECRWVGWDTMANFDGFLKYDHDIFSPSIHRHMLIGN